MRGRVRQGRTAVDGWTRTHWLAGGGAVLGWTVAVAVVLLIIIWGVTVVGLPRNPSSELAPLATQVALPQSKDPNDALDPKDRLALQRDLIQNAVVDRVQTWTLLAQVIGASVLAIGGYFTWRNLHVTQQTLKATQDKLEVDREAQITNRFTQAIGQLGELKEGKPNLEVRLGGIYALERIAHDSPRDHWTIMEVLTAYVRQNAPLSPPVSLPRSPSGRVMTPTDIQAALTVLGRRAPPDQRPELRPEEQRREPDRLMLRYTDLRGLGFRRHNDEDRAPNLRRASLRYANLTGAHLQGSDLRGADLTGAILRGAKLTGANLTGVDFKGSDLQEADLAHAILRDADLQDAHLQGMNLDYADLSSARHLTENQLNSTRSFRNASLPAELAFRISPLQETDEDEVEGEDEVEEATAGISPLPPATPPASS